MKTPRFFVAIPLPEDARKRLIAIQPHRASGIRLVEKDELHLTLHFLGELVPEHVDAAIHALSSLTIGAFEIGIQRIGCFLSERSFGGFWAEVEENSKLLALHHSTGIALTAAIGYRPEARRYSPHITLARFNEPVPPSMVDEFLKEKEGLQVPSFLIKEFVLYSSDFVDNEPRYQRVAAFQMASPAGQS